MFSFSELPPFFHVCVLVCADLSFEYFWAGLLAINWIGFEEAFCFNFVVSFTLLTHTNTRIIHWNQHHARKNIANQFFSVTHLFWSSHFFRVPLHEYHFINQFEHQIFPFHVLLERWWWFLSDFSSLWFCSQHTRRFCLILNAILCWRCLAFRMILLTLSLWCYHHRRRRHYRCYSTLLSYRSIESESRAFTKRPHDMHNISQPLTQFIPFYFIRSTAYGVPISLSLSW